MEKLIDEGLCKSIGLSNFNAQQVREVLANVKKHRPAVLQNESHPYLAAKDLRDLCRINNIVFQAYSPLGSFDRPWAKSGSLTSGPPPTGTELLDGTTSDDACVDSCYIYYCIDGCIAEIAKRLKKTTAQIVLRWHVQMGGVVAVKSVTPARIRSNIEIDDFTLSDNDMNAIADLNIGWRHLLWAEVFIFEMTFENHSQHCFPLI
jgi:alcohol dehydrogenase (NADP+)